MTRYLSNHPNHPNHSISTVNDEFPTICSKCIGSNDENASQYLNFIRSTMGSECKLCNRVYTSYKFKQSSNSSRYIHTEICKTCSTMKNICQCCLLDLEYGVAYWIRESVENGKANDQNVIGHQNELMNMYNAERMQNILDEKLRLKNREIGFQNEYQLQYHPESINQQPLGINYIQTNQINELPNSIVPYGFEIDTHTSIDQMVDLRDRKDLISKLKTPLPQTVGFVPPEDKSIKTLYVGPFDSIIDGIKEDDLRKNFAPYGPLRHIKIKKEKKCALITYVNREDAEIAAESLFGNILKIHEKKLNVQFVKKKINLNGIASQQKLNQQNLNEQTDLRDENMQDLNQILIAPPDSRLIKLLQIPENERPPLPEELPMLFPPHVFKQIHLPPGSQDNFIYPTQNFAKTKI